MRVKIDFRLNRQFGVVERLLFRLVLNGFDDTREIAVALPVFSDSVIANGIKNLVNRQILSARVEAGRLSLSEAIVAIIEMCLEKDCQLDVPNELEDEFENGGIIISSYIQEEARSLKKAILDELLPGVRLDMYTDSLDFIIYKNERGGQDG